MQNLHICIPLQEFISGTDTQNSSVSLRMDDYLSAYSSAAEPFGFSLLRQAIKEYESKNNISHEKSKQHMPFFRDYQCRLVGPEITPFAVRLFEEETTAAGFAKENAASVVITVGYSELAEQALMENMFLIRCKYNKAENEEYLAGQLEREYSKVFFDSENTGFSADSHFFSLLCNACLNICNPEEESMKEWRIVSMAEPEKASYSISHDSIKAYDIFNLPISSIRKISLVPDYKTNPALYSALIGWMKKYGLSPERILEGLLE